DDGNPGQGSSARRRERVGDRASRHGLRPPTGAARVALPTRTRLGLDRMTLDRTLLPLGSRGPVLRPDTRPLGLLLRAETLPCKATDLVTGFDGVRRAVLAHAQQRSGGRAGRVGAAGAVHEM